MMIQRIILNFDTINIKTRSLIKLDKDTVIYLAMIFLEINNLGQEI